MIALGITGANGLIGRHLQYYLHDKENIELVIPDREVFSSQPDLIQFASSCDVIVHLAGLNRGDEDDLLKTNIELTRKLIEVLNAAKRCEHVLFSSSIHSLGETAYGRSKKTCSDLLNLWAKENQTRFTNLILPHVFGEKGKPFNNSVVSTFCYQLANKGKPEIHKNAELELLHAQDLAEEIYELVINNTGESEKRLKGVPITVESLLKKLDIMASSYEGNIIPDFQEQIDLPLFNTYRSYLYPDFYPFSIDKHEDERGELFEAVKSLHQGQCFISTTKPGITRGNHYHRHKIERFLVIKGEACIRIREVISDRVIEYEVSGDTPVYIDIPTFHTHNITNTGDKELLTLFWSHEIFDPGRPDTYAEIV